MSAGFTGTRAAQLAGCTYRQLDYWDRTHLVQPALIPAQGSGSRRMYSTQDLLQLRLVKALLDNGMRLEQVREVFRVLRETEAPAGPGHLVVQGSNVFVCESEELADVIGRAPYGLYVISIGPLADDLEAELATVG